MLRSALFLLRHLVEEHHQFLFAGRPENFDILKRILRQAKLSAHDDEDDRARAQAQVLLQLLAEYTVDYLGLVR